MAPAHPPLSHAPPPAATAGQVAFPHVVAITSGKGGVGKSSIAVNLGLALAKVGRRVCILDADTGLANVNILLGMHPKLGLEHVLFGANTIEEVMLEAPHGLRVIPGASGISECVSLHPRQQMRLTRELARIEGNFDFMLLDTAAGIADTTLDFVSAAHQVLLVITPEPTSLTDAFSMLKLLNRRRPPACQVVVNMAGAASEARNVFHRFSAAVEKYIGLRVHLLGFILRDESLRSAVTLQHPVALYPDSDPSSRSFLRLAESLEQVVQEAPKPQSFSLYWQRRFQQRPVSEAEPSAPTRAREARESRAAPSVAGAPETPATSMPPENDRQQGAELSGGPSGREPGAPDMDPGRAQLLALLGQGDGESRAAQWLRDLHDAYWQATGTPALDPLQLVARLQPEVEDQADALARLRRMLSDGPASTAGPVISGSESACVAGKAREIPEQVDLRVGSGAESAMVDSGPRRFHAYDSGRFGSQEQFLELLRMQASVELPLVDLVRTLAANRVSRP